MFTMKLFHVQLHEDGNSGDGSIYSCIVGVAVVAYTHTEKKKKNVNRTNTSFLSFLDRTHRTLWKEDDNDVRVNRYAYASIFFLRRKLFSSPTLEVKRVRQKKKKKKGTLLLLTAVDFKVFIRVIRIICARETINK